MTDKRQHLAARLREINDDFELNVLGKRVPELDEVASVFERQVAGLLATHANAEQRSIDKLDEVESLLSYGMTPEDILSEIGMTAGGLAVRARRYDRPHLVVVFEKVRNAERRAKSRAKQRA